MMNLPDISLCMIVKNEEHCLGDCLSSVRDLVNQMVIIDTGSTDDTKKIAVDFGAEIYEEPWQDDFAFARNISLRHAKGDWILVLDADHIFHTDPGFNLHKKLAHSPNLGYVFNEKSFIHKKLAGQIHRLLLIKNIKGLKYSGRIHENPLESLYQYAEKNHVANPVGKLKEIWVEHKGFENPLVKLQRNLPILKKAIEENPLNTHYQYKLLLSLRSVNLNDEYEKFIKTSFENVKKINPAENLTNSKLGIFGLYGQWLLSTGASKIQTDTYLDIAIDWGEKTQWGDARLVLPCARLLIKKGAIQKAKQILENSVKSGTGENTSTLSINDHLDPYILLFDCYWKGREPSNIVSLISKLAQNPDKMARIFEKIAAENLELFTFLQQSMKSQKEVIQ